MWTVFTSSFSSNLLNLKDVLSWNGKESPFFCCHLLVFIRGSAEGRGIVLTLKFFLKCRIPQVKYSVSHIGLARLMKQSGLHVMRLRTEANVSMSWCSVYWMSLGTMSPIRREMIAVLLFLSHLWIWYLYACCWGAVETFVVLLFRVTSSQTLSSTYLY
jgi:hypothetical protein